ncbi:MAG: asparagine synthase (glutamine-hydrolyzing) [Desulfobacteraceae bacterium]|jgi:asparagine synthase (glutamine-hydrolysing)|nr:MAG: asparagine synthase (glutamine-hydrolyzing) [Desulfobacteraceae bacterium]
MCGICGQYNFRYGEPVVHETLARMTSSMVHRGPDDEGYHLSGPIGLGFRRLSIIDLAGGHQPMSSQDEKVWVVFNGEIYNFPELKKELEELGHIFRTRSDTEVIVHGYKQWGSEVLSHLNGMFGLAIWDEESRRLLLARDAMGIKLVYYRFEKDSLYFGSEIRPIFAALKEAPQVDVVGLNLFLRYRYTPSPHTLYKGIKKLPPGCMLHFEDGNFRFERWYNYKPVPFISTKSYREAGDELLEIYKRALKRHLLSDVPLGLLLSGGIDSGLLLALMNLYGKDWPTFTVGYGKDFADDEISDAAETARVLSAQNVAIELNRGRFENELSRVVSVLEEPVASSSIVPMYFVCERARQDVKVALIGQGPDELFGGYSRHLGVHYGHYWRRMPGWMKQPLAAAIRALPRNESLKRGVNSLDVLDRMRRYQEVFSITPGNLIDGLFQQDILPRGAGDEILACWENLEPSMVGLDELGGFQLLELRSSLPDELLMYADKLSMAHSLEVRVPYLDREVVEFSQRLTADYKIRNGTRKWLHREVCKGFLPKEIIARKKKGFAVKVVDSWFYDSMNKRLDDLLTDPGARMYEFLKIDRVTSLLEQHRARRQDYHKILFSLAVFEEWLRLFVHNG